MILLKEAQIAEQQQTVAAEKPQKFILQVTYPFGDLDDRSFELLLYSLAQSRTALFRFDYDHVGLALAGGDKGRDVVLFKNGLLCGVIQCKRTNVLIDRASLAKEILKFVLHALQDGMMPSPTPPIHYMIACSLGLNREAIAFVESYPSSLVNDHQKLETLCSELLAKYATLTIDFSAESQRILTALRGMRVTTLLPADLSVALASNVAISKTFFELQSVIDATKFEDIIKGRNLDVTSFLRQYAPSIKTNFSRVNFFGLSLTRRPREIELYALFVSPIFRRSGQRPTPPSSFRALCTDSLNIGESLSKVPSVQIPLPIWTELHSPGSVVSDWASSWINAVNGDEIIQLRRPAKAWTLSAIMAYERNFVILGGPGTGKSSLIKYTMCKIADRDASVIGSKLIHRIPFRVELSAYNTFRSANNGGFAAFLANRLAAENQLSFISQANVQSLLEQYDTFAFFDGLDEVVDPVQRANVRNDIENFSRNTPRARVIVTCRPEAFADVPFKEREFELFEVENFSDPQITEYVGRWYDIEEPDTTLRVAEARQCLSEVSSVEEELRRNPLLLSLLLIIYRNNLEFPTSKLEIYESCANTLVETRDKKEKKLDYPSGTQNRIAAFSALAFWQYEAIASKARQITHTEALQFLSSYLLQKGECEDEPSALEAARQFLEFARLRSLYVDNSFTHKTFLEYFTANYIFTNYHSKGRLDSRDELFDRYFGDVSWSVVFELLLCRIDRDQPDFEVMDSIIEQQLARNPTACSADALHILRYLRNVSVSTKKHVLQAGLTSCIDPATPSKIRVLIGSRFATLAVDVRFTKLFLEIIQDAASRSSHKAELIAFLLESSIQHPGFATLIPASLVPSESADPYVHLLLRFPFLTDTSSRAREFKVFSQKFGRQYVLDPYASHYGGGIFGGSSSFSWIPAVLLSGGCAEEIAKAYGILHDMGYRAPMIEKAIRRDSRRLDLDSGPVVKCLETTSLSSLRHVLREALRKYWNINLQSEQQKQPYYARQNQRRRFPVPK
ncbi:MAG: NACHT domain-containing protein [Syntrophales bacterium]|jgi:hypothetical protein|nr:NACHT domain-containing protein [Syntrophales bacterium]